MILKKIPQSQFDAIYSQVPRLCVDLVARVGKGIVFLKRDVKPYKGKWAIPGATVLMGERLEEAVQRVARDKLGVKVKIVKKLGLIEFFISPKSHCVSVVYLVKIVSGEIKPDDHIKVSALIPENIVKAQAKFLIDKLDIKSTS